jgi:hypothetical protein
MSQCCRKKTETERLEVILADLSGLSNLQRNILRERFFGVLYSLDRRCYKYSLIYHLGHFIITVGSLIVPALMSIQYADTGNGFIQNFQTTVYWVTWVISLLVTTSNGVIALFKVDKKYFFLHTTCERLRSEGWQYFELTGRYSGQLIQYEIPPNHANQFIFFTHAVEKIKMRQIEEEYYKQEDTHNNPQMRGSAAGSAAPQPNGQPKSPEESLYTPSPERPIELISSSVPHAVHEAVNAIIRSNTSSQNLPTILENAGGGNNQKKESPAVPV